MYLLSIKFRGDKEYRNYECKGFETDVWYLSVKKPKPDHILFPKWSKIKDIIVLKKTKYELLFEFHFKSKVSAWDKRWEISSALKEHKIINEVMHTETNR